MESANFVDYVRIHAEAGDGGAGAVHFHRTRHTSKGGPDGGDGGRGGHIGIVADAGCWTLLHLRYKRHIRAGHGGRGGSNAKQGAQGADVWIRVPAGTVVKDDVGDYIGEVLHADQRLQLLQGGKGGRGNAYFKTATRQAPDYAQTGVSGEKKTLTLELQLLADVGLVGRPNAGKSTLLSRISAAKPKIAPYAFTTLQPVLGMVALSEDRSCVMADLPGLLEGAAEGKGLGLRFLRHVARTALLLFVISAEEEDVAGTYAQLTDELARYSSALVGKPRLLVISKSDLVHMDNRAELTARLSEDMPYHFLSAWTDEGLATLKKHLQRALHT